MRKKTLEEVGRMSHEEEQQYINSILREGKEIALKLADELDENRDNVIFVDSPELDDLDIAQKASVLMLLQKTKGEFQNANDAERCGSAFSALIYGAYLRGYRRGQSEKSIEEIVEGK